MSGDCTQGAVEDLCEATNKPKTVCVPASRRLTNVVRVGDEQPHGRSRRHSVSLPRQLAAHRQLHVRKARRVDDDCPELATLDFSLCGHDDVHVRVLCVAVNCGNPGRRAAGITPQLVHCSPCQSFEVEALGMLGGENHPVSSSWVLPRSVVMQGA
jgi:hypothetical protein